MPSMSDSEDTIKMNFMEIKQFLTIQLMSDMTGISGKQLVIFMNLEDEKLVVKDHKIG